MVPWDIKLWCFVRFDYLFLMSTEFFGTLLLNLMLQNLMCLICTVALVKLGVWIAFEVIIYLGECVVVSIGNRFSEIKVIAI